MERKLALIENILELNPIPGADKIEVAKIKGWNVVVKKGDFKVDDKVVYCEVDSILPERPEFEFLKEDDAPCYDVEKITKDESVLVAMLEEAGQ